MRLKILALILCLSLLLPGCNIPQTAGTASPVPSTPTFTPIPPTPTDTPIPPTPTPTLPPAPVLPILLESQFSEIVNSPATYTITANYPHLDPASVSQTEPFDAEVETIVMNVINSMRTDFLANFSDLPPHAAAYGSYLEINFNAPYVSPSVISVTFVFHFYFAGAAHPNMMYQSYNYDVANHRALALADIFQPSSNYLQVVSDSCVAELTARLGTDGWMGGASPDLINFKTWNITPAGLLITFDPYQVAPYAAGPQEVLIPYTALESIYLPQYRP